MMVVSDNNKHIDNGHRNTDPSIDPKLINVLVPKYIFISQLLTTSHRNVMYRYLRFKDRNHISHRVTQIRTLPFNIHFESHNQRRVSICEFCDKELSIKHITLECPIFYNSRQILRNSSTILQALGLVKLL
ncbi:Uncharacterized protein FWK35_00003894 [Aphis craccivora]|uniref:RNase H domain-containing protein n=1 Tax=Aphis craccivora TaxID=307492 RepID=A0A6G0ZB82_APHCR|nr:Uncharacterized protein FWK35_00003894 [Aphis craccivora]